MGVARNSEPRAVKLTMEIMKRCFVLITLLASSTFSSQETACSLPDSVAGRGTEGATCIGDRVSFVCNSSDPSASALRWKYGAAVIDFFRGDSSPFRYTQPPYNYTLTSSTPVIASVAVVMVTAGFDTSAISCFSHNGTETLLKKGCIVLAAPPIVANFNPTSCTLSSVTVQWTAISAVGPVDGYVLTAARAQQINGSVSTYIVGPKTNSYTFSSLVPGAWYNITAQGVICSKTQYGIKSEVTVTVTVPQYPQVTVCTVYSTTLLVSGIVSEVATELRTNWNVPLGVELVGPQLQPLPCELTAGYTVSYVCDQNAAAPASYYVASSNCGQLCSHTYSLNFTPGSTCNVSVTSENIQLATTVMHSEPRNTLLSVNISSVIPPLSLSCVLLSGLVGTSGCSFSIGPSPDQLVYSSASSGRGSHGESLLVAFDEATPLQPSTKYFYEATLKSPSNNLQCIVVAGSFTTGTWCSFEGGWTSAQNKSACQCNNGSRIAFVINGCVCYSGIAPGSKAYYKCDNGYEQAIECLQDGKWSGTPPLCRNSSTKVHASEAKLGAGGIAGVTIGIVATIGLALLLAVALLLIRRKVIDDTRWKKKRRRTVRKTSEDLPTTKKDQPYLTIRVDHEGGHWLVPPAPPETVVYSTIKRAV